jgi:hypothetical protein
MGSDATPPQPALHLSSPDATNGVAMLSSPDAATPALHLSAPDGLNNTFTDVNNSPAGANNNPAGVTDSVIGVNNTFVTPPDVAGSASPGPHGAGSPGTFGFNLSPPNGVSPQFAAVWSSLVDNPTAQSLMQKLFTGTG